MMQDVNFGVFQGALIDNGVLPWTTKALRNEGCILDYDFSIYPGVDNYSYNVQDITGNRNTGRMGNNSNPYSPSVYGSRHIQAVNAIEVPTDIKGIEHNIHWDLNWTIEVWLKCFAFTTLPQQYKGIYSSYNGNNPALYGAAGIQLWPFLNAIRIGLTPPVGIDAGINFFVFSQNWIVSEMENKWCHFVFTAEDGQYFSCYSNGSKKFSTIFDFKNHPTRVNRTSNRSYCFGGDAQSNYVDSLIARTRFYNRPLTEWEVFQNFQAYKSRFYHDN